MKSLKMALSNIGTEVKLRGGPENDYPTGDFVWPCMHCDAEFHGEEYDYMCYKCATEEDQQNDPKNSYEMDPKDLIIAALVAAVLLGLIFL
jgi:Zn finger protein HypA/HybF involved in hydrogenase expression